ncbi:LuxR C-terminal-related transcriptional regulator [Kitasatospora sp. NPDC002227]|uniref:helix-turn-helix transcriptional regulator n=1 Tax=Kitasatospora sp. NPDC002227 TaxID=3154773 RepID=UPI0033205A26
MTIATGPSARAVDGHPAAGPAHLAERREPLTLAAEMAERARRGHGGVLLLTGPAGTGRSALLTALVRAEEPHGTHTRWARCSEDETEEEYAVARQLFATEAHAHTTEADLWELLHLHTAHHPLLLAVDDIQLADAPSRRWLLRLARRTDRLPVLLAVTERRQRELPTRAPRFGHTLPTHLAQHCRIGALSASAVREVVHRRLGPGTPPGLAEDCARATGGNPLLLQALLTDLAEAPGPATGLPAHCAVLPVGAYVEAVERWLHSAGRGHAAAVRALATLQGHRLGHPDRLPDPPAALAELAAGAARADLDPECARAIDAYGEANPARLADLLAGLHRQGLLLTAEHGRWPRFAHPLLREAVLDGWGPAHPARVHHAAATALHGRGEPDELIAEHLLRTPGPTAPWAADTLLRAARTAQRAEHPEAAVGYLRRVLAERLADTARSSALTELGCLEISLGPAEHAAGVRHLTEAVRLHQSDERVFEVANALGAALAGQGDTPSALDILEQLAERFGDRPELAAAVQAAAALIASHDGDSWLHVVQGLRRISARSPHRLAPAAWSLLTEYEATNGRLSATEVAGRVKELTAAGHEPFSRAYVLASTATLAQWAERFTEADQLVAQGLAEHQGPLLHPARQSLLSVRAESLVMRGQYRRLLAELGLDGTELAEDEIGGPVLPVIGNSHLLAQGVIALTETGRLAAAHQLAQQVTRTSDSWEWNEYLYARGLLHLASGEPAAALEDLLECGRRQSERHVESPIVTPWRSAAADCHLLLGNPGPAAALATTELELARAWGTPRTIGRATRALGAATGGRRGLALAAEAVELLRTPEAEVELVPALLTHGRMLGDGGRRAAARQSLREAAERAELIGALRLRDLAVALLRESGARLTKDCHTGESALTDSERRICRLAAEGHSNADIATLLHLAVRTVETHLTNSFRKLGVRGRGELGAALG